LGGGVTHEAEQIIATLELVPLPHEGGFFRRMWTSRATLAGNSAERAMASAIYFLLTRNDFSALHRLRTDEIWCFHGGDPVDHVELDAANGRTRVQRLGANVLAGERPQQVVGGGVWQGARLAGTHAASMAEDVPRGWALLSCIMAPAWDEREFELGERERLLREFPAEAEWIGALTR
jgi:predicted cupin superfamily sugar epimerase